MKRSYTVRPTIRTWVTLAALSTAAAMAAVGCAKQDGAQPVPAAKPAPAKPTGAAVPGAGVGVQAKGNPATDPGKRCINPFQANKETLTEIVAGDMKRPDGFWSMKNVVAWEEIAAVKPADDLTKALDKQLLGVLDAKLKETRQTHVGVDASRIDGKVAVASDIETPATVLCTTILAPKTGEATDASLAIAVPYRIDARDLKSQLDSRAKLEAVGSAKQTLKHRLVSPAADDVSLLQLDKAALEKAGKSVQFFKVSETEVRMRFVTRTKGESTVELAHEKVKEKPTLKLATDALFIIEATYMFTAGPAPDKKQNSGDDGEKGDKDDPDEKGDQGDKGAELSFDLNGKDPMTMDASELLDHAAKSIRPAPFGGPLDVMGSDAMDTGVTDPAKLKGLTFEVPPLTLDAPAPAPATAPAAAPARAAAPPVAATAPGHRASTQKPAGH